MTEPGDLLAGEPAADNQETTPWYGDEYKEVVTQKGWSNPSDALKSYTELEKAYGGTVKIPTEESSPDEKSAFYTKIGRPENPDGYEIKDVPDNIPRNEGFEAVMRKVAFEQGVPKLAFEAQAKSYFDALSQDIAQARVEGENALKGEWKENYSTNLEIARRFAREGGEDFLKLLDETGLGSNPVFVRAFFGYGTKTIDDSLIKGESSGDKTGEWKPPYVGSPEMYATGDDEESQKAREWFKQRGHIY